MGRFKLDVNLATKIISFKEKYKLIFLCLFTKSVFSIRSVEADIIILYGYSKSSRKDYDEMIKFVSEVLDTDFEIVNYNREYSIGNFFEVIKLFFFYKFEKNYSYLEKLLFSKALSESYDIIKFVEVSKFKKIITFCDAMLIDSIFTQYCNFKGITTITLQHGQYYIRKKDCAENAALESLFSKYLLCWGEATAEQYASLGRKDTLCIEVGLPFFYLKQPKVFPTDINVFQMNVHLNADNDEKLNIQLINLMMHYCKNNLAKISINYHPKSNRNKYKKYIDESYIVGHEERAVNIVISSGVIIKLLQEGLPLICFSNDDDIFTKYLLSFDSSKELHGILQRKHDIIISCESARSYFIAEGDSLENYRQALSNIEASDEFK